MPLYATNTAQDEREFDAYCDTIEREAVKSYLEIGSKFGGSLWRVSSVLQPGSRIVSIDLPKGTKAWRESEQSLRGCIDALNDNGHDASVVWGSSQDAAVIETARALGPFDAIFIDADHRLPGVTADWNSYGPMGRIVALHDIGWRRAPDWVGTRIDVPEFWNAIKGGYRHQEFKLCPTGKNNGIGVLWRA